MTGNPELAVAFSAKVPPPTCVPGFGPCDALQRQAPKNADGDLRLRRGCVVGVALLIPVNDQTGREVQGLVWHERERRCRDSVLHGTVENGEDHGIARIRAEGNQIIGSAARGLDADRRAQGDGGARRNVVQWQW